MTWFAFSRITHLRHSSAPPTNYFSAPHLCWIRVRSRGDRSTESFLRLPVMSSNNISGGATQLLLHAATCTRLGLLPYDLHGSNFKLLAVPALPCGSDEQWIRQREADGADGPTVLAAAAASILSVED